MRVLALDSSGAAGSVAVIADDRILLERRGEPARPHAERLPGDLLDLLADARLSLGDIDLFAVSCGPGSFTGLRIGIATMQGLAFTTGRPIVALSGLEGCAHAASLDLEPGTLLGVWIDAHRRDVFGALYRVAEGPRYARGRLVEIDPPSVGAPAEIYARWVGRFGVPAVLTGDGARLYGSVIDSAVVLVEAPPLAGTIGLVAGLASPEERLRPGDVQPLYVRRPDAEVARDARERRALRGTEGEAGQPCPCT